MLRRLKSWYKKGKKFFVEIGGMAPSADRSQSTDLMPPAPHNDLHPTAHNYTQKEGREDPRAMGADCDSP
jgi:hypothetical protein